MRGEGTGTTSHVSPMGNGTSTPLSPGAVTAPSNEEGLRFTEYTERQEYEAGQLLGGLPGIACNGCAAAEACPKFEENAACYYEQDFDGLTSRDLSNIVPRLEVIADMQFKRGMHAAFVERRKSGGQLLPEVTRQLEIAAHAAERVARLKTPAQKGMTSPVSVVIQNNQNGASGGGGLVQKLMAGVMGKAQGQPGAIVINEQKQLDAAPSASPVIDVPAEIMNAPIGEGS